MREYLLISLQIMFLSTILGCSQAGSTSTSSSTSSTPPIQLACGIREITISSDGSKFFDGGNSSSIPQYSFAMADSLDGGLLWNPNAQTSYTHSYYWKSIYTINGVNITAAENSPLDSTGDIWTSSDSGTTWTNKTGAYRNSDIWTWNQVVSSSD